MWVLGHKPANLSESMKVIKGLSEGRETTYDGTTQHLPWAKESELKLLMAAYGPKTLNLCGSQIEGFILQLADPLIAEWTIGAVRRAAEEARSPGRRPVRYLPYA
jgi:hypothetical protein